MKSISQKPFKVGNLIVSEEWKIEVPSIQIRGDDVRFQKLVRTLEKVGAPPLRAEEIAAKGCANVFEGGWCAKARMFVIRQAEAYLDAYGDLDGFFPEEAQTFYIPASDNYVWKGRKNFLVREMRKGMRR